MSLNTNIHNEKFYYLFVIKLLLLTIFLPVAAASQIDNQSVPAGDGFTNSVSEKDKNKFIIEKDFRVETVPVAGGAEIITIFAKLKGLRDSSQETVEEVPLVSILRDTLGDDKIENDRLRYVWMLSYTKPSLSQRFAAAIPFLYKRTTNKKKTGNDHPPPVIDINSSNKDFWDKIYRLVFRNLILANLSAPIKAPTMQYKMNAKNYRRVSIARTLAILSLYESAKGEKGLSEDELHELQVGLLLYGKFQGALLQSESLERVYQSNKEKTSRRRGQNWELLRQYSEMQGLYFEPLEMSDGTATHALVWAAVSDLEKNRNNKFDGRFLNIKNPWNDKRLVNWKGYTETRWFDADNRPVESDTPNAVAKTLIPLAIYGLDYPKIPVILVDFRDRNNPKKREISGRVVNDLTKNVFSVSRFGNLPYSFGHFIYSFVTGRRGIDINQPTRLGSYSQLKFLLSLDASLKPEFRDEIADRLETVSLNPLENDLETEIKLARRQYENLMIYTENSEGLPKQIEKDRRAEMTRLKHTGKRRMLYSLTSVLSFGVYRHREKYTPELRREMNVRRQLGYYETYLLEVARTSVKPEIDADLDAINRSLSFIAANGIAAQAKTAVAIAKIFSITADEQIRLLCLSSLDRIENRTAKNELLAIYENQTIDLRWRNLASQYLKLPALEIDSLKASNIKKAVKTNEK